MGWRGFLQAHLEARLPPVSAAGLVSVPWALWHLPLSGVTPSYRAMPSIGFTGFVVSIWVASWIFAWLLHLGRRSSRGRQSAPHPAPQPSQPSVRSRPSSVVGS
ncbi:CAAX protease self-immunity [Geodermatophilus obscurus]|uniref:CAAX protease self-immunity n=1 Tax=Geodermatophilus obscurus TaxID=1861 RepID=A0A1I5HJ93_9ACTN|nr:CAAX protease self-immunity [Geodermatophilus obscurus]